MKFASLGLIVAILVAGAGWGASAQTPDEIAINRADAARYTDAELIGFFAAGFDDGRPGSYRRMRDAFPEEFEAFERDMVKEVRSGMLTTGRAIAMGYRFTRDLAGKYRGAMAKAPQHLLVASANAQLETLKTLRGINLTACHELGELGMLSEASTLSLPAGAEEAMRRFADVQLEALLAGRATPVDHPRVTETDMNRLLDAYQRRGGSTTILGALGTHNIAAYAPAERCDAMITLLEALAEQPPPMLARIWAFLFNPEGGVGQTADATRARFV